MYVSYAVSSASRLPMSSALTHTVSDMTWYNLCMKRFVHLHVFLNIVDLPKTILLMVEKQNGWRVIFLSLWTHHTLLGNPIQYRTHDRATPFSSNSVAACQL